jgi:hypothetical protein
MKILGHTWVASVTIDNQKWISIANYTTIDGTIENFQLL